MQKMRLIVRTTGITWIFSITLAFVYSMRLFWLMEMPHPGAITLRMSKTVGEVLYSSLYTTLSGSIVAFIAIPLAAWSIGSASWGSLKRYIYSFWSVLALFVVVSGNPSGLILISGAGLVALWFLRNRSTTGGNSQIRTTSRMFGSKRNTTAFVILAVITGALLLFLFFGKGTKAYVVEICSIYAIACIFQGIKVFSTMERGQNANHEIKL